MRLVLSIYKTLNDTDHTNLVISIVPQRGRRCQGTEWRGKESVDSKDEDKSLSSTRFRLGCGAVLPLWEGLRVCRETELRWDLSGTKSEIPMICLAKRVREKWIKAVQDQRNASVKSTWPPRDQQGMHMIYKLFFRTFWCWRIDCYCC